MIRFGTIDFANAYPFFYALHRQIIPNNARIHFGSPVENNTMLKKGLLDVALISSAAFLADRYSYILLSDLGLAGTKSIVSNRIFFKEEDLQLHQRKVYLPSYSATSSQLLQILCRYFWHVTPIFEKYDHSPEALFNQEYPFLVIGDACLKYQNTSGFNSLDILHAWHEATNKSFIFGVIATNNASFKQNREGIIEFHRLLQNSFTWAQENQEIIVQETSQELGKTEKEMREYFNTIEYRLLSKHFHGLDYFSTFRP